MAGVMESTKMGAGPSVIEKGYKIGISSDFWNRYEEDIQLTKDIGEYFALAPFIPSHSSRRTSVNTSHQRHSYCRTVKL